MRPHSRLVPILAFGTALAALPAAAQLNFTPIDTNFNTATHIVPASPIQSTILFRGYVDTATNKNGVKALAKDWNDFTGYIPINGRSDSGYVIVNNEQNVRDSVHGDGGGMTVFTAHMKNNTWSVANHPNGKYRSVDFTNVGGTIANCGGGVTPWGTVLTAEEWVQASNTAIHAGGTGYRDTSDYTLTQFNGSPINKIVKRYQNLNWIVEVNPATASAVKKHYNMGRYEHELGYAMADQKTVYLTDDATPAVFFKFVSDTAGNYNKGQLYAYQQSTDGLTGSWITLPMDIDSMLVIRTIALRRGATTFTRLEWATEANGKIFITETGTDATRNHATTLSGLGRPLTQIAKHLRDRYAGTLNDTATINDYYGRILRLDPATGKLDVFLEGGAGSAGSKNHLSNPDGLTSVTLNGKTWLVVQEDLNGKTFGRVPGGASAKTICEMYWIDASLANPTVDSLKRMMIGPNNSELTGGRFTPDGRTLFVNVQHPDTGAVNGSVYKGSYTVALTGYAGPTGLNFDRPAFQGGASGKIQVEINALSRFAYFSRKADVEVFNTAGKRLERHRGITQLDIQPYDAGSYYLRFDGKDTHKLVLQ